jgi:hypothetical protein
MSDTVIGSNCPYLYVWKMYAAVGITPPKQFNANLYISFGYGLQPINNARLLIGGKSASASYSLLPL